MDIGIVTKLIVALLLGGFMGLEREYHKDEAPAKKGLVSSLGVRTFSLLTIMGALAGIFYSTAPAMTIIVSSSVLLLILGNYVVGTLQTKDSGITTEIASMLSFVIGVILVLEVLPMQVTIAVAVIATLIMSRKTEIKKMVAKLHAFETNAFITYALIALVVLPFLPNQPVRVGDLGFLSTLATAYGMSLDQVAQVEIVNPYKLWFIVALITGIDMLGYYLNKYLGQGRGYLLAAITGGFVSSTGTTIALAQESKHSRATNKLVSAALLANTASFFQLIFLIAPISSAMLVASTMPLVGIILSGFLTAAYFLFIRKDHSTKTLSIQKKAQTQVFSLTAALKFAGLYLLVRFVSNLALEFMGNSGVYITSALGALVGLDAVTINVADLAGRGILHTDVAVASLLIANAINLLAKTVYSYVQGSGEFTLKFGLSVCVIIVLSVVMMIVV